MRKFSYLAASGAALVLAGSISTTTFAWHPQGNITKYVQNVTTSSLYADANDAQAAVIAEPGDTLKYKMVVTNPAPAADRQYNDLAFIKVTDALPVGVTLVSGGKDRDFGTAIVVPQSTATNKMGNGVKSVEYEFTVKVNADVANKTVICNTATFKGNSVKQDAPRNGSDKACVKVTVPPEAIAPTPEEPKPESPTPGMGGGQMLATSTELPAVIPATGAESLAGLGTGMSALAYVIAARLQRCK